MTEKTIVVDGSLGEGGGQVLRTALTLAALTGRTTQVENIRSGRRNPGLRPQHLTAVHAAAAICDAQLEGAQLESQSLRFAPGGPIRAGEYTFDVEQVAERGSAGSVGLVLQTVLLPLALTSRDSELTLRGGTHVKWAPSIDYVRDVYLPTLAGMGPWTELELVTWGFYPTGGGEVEVRIRGRGGPISPIQLTERGSLERIWGRGVVTNLPSHIPQRMVNRARNLLEDAGLEADLEARREGSRGPGAGIFLSAQYEGARAGFTAYGRKGLPAEKVAQKACQALLDYHHAEAPTDPHLADQMVLPMALAAGTSRLVTTEVTGHLLTNLQVTQQFLPLEVELKGERGMPGTVTIKGMGWTND